MGVVRQHERLRPLQQFGEARVAVLLERGREPQELVEIRAVQLEAMSSLHRPVFAGDVAADQERADGKAFARTQRRVRLVGELVRSGRCSINPAGDHDVESARHAAVRYDDVLARLVGRGQQTRGEELECRLLHRVDAEHRVVAGES